MKQKIQISLLALSIPFLTDLSLAQGPAKSKKSFAFKKITVNYLSKGRGGFEGFESRGLGGLSQTQHVGKWAQVEVEYKSDPDWADQADLTFYVLTQKGVVLDGTISQINIERGSNHFAVVFLHPNTVERFGQIVRAAVRLSYAGQVHDSVQWPMTSKKEWWNQYPRKTGLLKKISQTPFLLNQPGRYEDAL